MIEKIGFIIIYIGIAFDFFGILGLLRFPDVYNRLQASTKCVTLGTCGIMFGVFLIGLARGMPSLAVKALIALPLIFLTVATGSHALARGAHKFGIKLWEKSVCDKYKEDKGDK